ncbi:hypothetical protein RHSIM_Rhsim06G0035700 [Rhododendron simsii]|uniref:PPPDE domain-containing protein n=1 Tax=Rhododendron simsii TaxID=118357 RepID=A0A834GTR8_RHOSS|nr:hypothetical protein RHSIM_Rhsim06G0035700 [Rhododendron simsii]
MRFGPKKGWLHFCIFPRVKPDTDDAGDAPVYLNVYDLTPVNGYIYWAGFGIFHSGVEEELNVLPPLPFMHISVHGAEYAFGAHDSPSSGVFEVEPRQCPGFKFRKSLLIGTTCLDALEVRKFMEYHSSNYYGNTYSLIAKNCNHFCEDVCYRLTRKPIPKWVNRLAEIVSIDLDSRNQGPFLSSLRVRYFGGEVAEGHFRWDYRISVKSKSTTSNIETVQASTVYYLNHSTILFHNAIQVAMKNVLATREN